MDYVQSEWYKLCHSTHWWKIISTHYEEQGRCYHTLSHIERMLKIYAKYIEDESREEKWEIKMAIFFHDIIYDPKAKDNEEKSAELFPSFCQDMKTISIDLQQQVYWMILSTKTHRLLPRSELSNEYLANFLLFLDLDLETLAASAEEYAIYKNNIRKEYQHYSDQDYKNGRVTVLQSLSQGNIYFTSYFKQNYEMAAKNNISA